MSDQEAEEALNHAVDQLAAIIRLIDKARRDAKRLGDRDMVERLARARAAAERGDELLTVLRRSADSRQNIRGSSLASGLRIKPSARPRT